ncbi:MAG: methyltransferase domain-containing protein [Oscillospiraceae bacterium]|nr:methyltransferase domain-containing protein [Oscillospiraceae bacterium]
MSASYGPLAGWYDRLTADVPYGEFADFYEREFAADGGEFKALLDLCCGTGTLTWLLAERGYDMIGADASPDMLMQASAKASSAASPLFLCQEAAELDLYGTVDAAVCSLDGMDYIPPEELPEVFRRLRLFVRPQGLVIFDIKSPDWFRSIDGEVFVDESRDMLCLWRADFDEEENCICYGMDIFSRQGRLWRRESEEHIEYAHSPELLRSLLEEQGFENVRIIYDCPQAEAGRIFMTAKRNAVY